MDSEGHENAITVNRKLLYEAVVFRGIEQVKILLNGGVSVNTILEDDITVLCLAIKINNIELSKYLLDKGADINYCSGGSRPLHLAIIYSSFDFVKYLVDKGANINAIASKKTPLHVAISEEKNEITKYLLDNGANVNPTCINFTIETPLHLAVRLRNFKVIKYLIDRGAYVNAVFDNKTPLHLAISLDHEETIGEDKNKVAKYLIKKGANVNFVSENKTPTHLAAERNNLELLKQLLSKGASLNIVCDSPSPLHFAITNNNLEMVKFLSTKLVNVNFICANTTPLHLAIHNNNNKIVKLLLDKGADVNAICDNKTALHLAIIRQNLKSVGYLVQKGANVNLISGDKTPLQLAINSKSPELVKYLIENGADLAAICDNKTLLGVAACCSSLEIASYLLEKGADLDYTRDYRSFLPVAARHYMLHLVRRLINNGVDVNSIEDKISSLYFEMEKYFRKIPEHLGVYGDDPNLNWGRAGQEILLGSAVCINFNSMARSMMEQDAIFNSSEILLMAIRNRNLEIVEYLIAKHKVDVNESYENLTPLFQALRSAQFEMVKLLIDNGADVNCLCRNMSSLETVLPDPETKSATVEYLMIAGYDVNMEDENKNVAADHLENYVYRFNIVEIVQKHIIKLIAANLYVCLKNQKAASDNRSYELIYRQCAEEVSLMKLNQVSVTIDAGATCYDLLKKSIHKSALRFKKLFRDGVCFEKPTIPPEILERLNHYRKILEFRLVQVLERAELLVKVDNFVVDIARRLLVDPEIVREIFEYFNNRELKMISDSL